MSQKTLRLSWILFFFFFSLLIIFSLFLEGNIDIHVQHFITFNTLIIFNNHMLSLSCIGSSCFSFLLPISNNFSSLKYKHNHLLCITGMLTFWLMGLYLFVSGVFYDTFCNLFNFLLLIEIQSFLAIYSNEDLLQH